MKAYLKNGFSKSKNISFTSSSKTMLKFFPFLNRCKLDKKNKKNFRIQKKIESFLKFTFLKEANISHVFLIELYLRRWWEIVIVWKKKQKQFSLRFFKRYFFLKAF
jgi:hypothetical protein